MTNRTPFVCFILLCEAACSFQGAWPAPLKGSVVQWGEAVLPSVQPGVSFKSIASGYESAYALTTDGLLIGWRENFFGEIPPFEQASNIVAMSSDTHTLALKSDGTVGAWGDNLEGGANVPPGLSNVIAVSAAGGHSLALKSDGTVVAWGDNFCGESDVPPGLNNIVGVSAGPCISYLLQADGTVIRLANHTNTVINDLGNVVQIAQTSIGLMLQADGHVVHSTIDAAAWSSGQLRFTNSVVPGLSNVIAVAGGGGDIALQSDGTVYRLGTTESCSCEAVAIASGESGMFALRADGTVIQFGPFFVPTYPPWFFTRQITTLPSGGGDLIASPDGTVISLRDPDPMDFIAWSNTVAISTGYGFSLGLQSNGTVLAIGDNSDYQCDVPPGLSNVVAIAAGGYHSVALKADGSVVGWGYNAYGQASSGNVGAMAISAGALHTLALLSNHTVIAWGDDNHNQINTPNGLTNVIAIAAGGAHNLALTTAGTVYAWGYDNHGQIDVPSGLSNVVAIAAGGDHSLALKSDGTIVAWGSNSYGESTVPGYLGPARAISAGFDDSMALVLPVTPCLAEELTTDGIVLSWPSVYGGFTLQCSNDPASGSWTDCLSDVSTIGNQFVVTNSLFTTPRFFRLRK